MSSPESSFRSKTETLPDTEPVEAVPANLPTDHAVSRSHQERRQVIMEGLTERVGVVRQVFATAEEIRLLPATEAIATLEQLAKDVRQDYRDNVASLSAYDPGMSETRKTEQAVEMIEVGIKNLIKHIKSVASLQSDPVGLSRLLIKAVRII